MRKEEKKVILNLCRECLLLEEEIDLIRKVIKGEMIYLLHVCVGVELLWFYMTCLLGKKLFTFLSSSEIIFIKSSFVLRSKELHDDVNSIMDIIKNIMCYNKN